MYTPTHSDHDFILKKSHLSTPARNLSVYVPGNNHSREEYSSPGNSPLPLPFDKCDNPTYMNCSKVQQIMGLLHEYFYPCLTRKCISSTWHAVL